MFFWGSQMLGAALLAAFLENKKSSRMNNRQKAIQSCAFVTLFCAATWAAAIKVCEKQNEIK
jgi:hypothetical protein